jgi:hypothetical protein
LAVFAGAKNPTCIAEKVFLLKLNFFIFSRSLPGELISLLSNAVVVRCPLSSFPLVVRGPISHAVVVCPLRRPPLSSWLGIPIFGSDFWDPSEAEFLFRFRFQRFRSVFFLKFQCLESLKIGIQICDIRNSGN